MSLRPSVNHDTQRFGGIFVPDVPAIHTEDGADSLWDELLRGCPRGWQPALFLRRDRDERTISKGLYIAPDSPSAKNYAQILLTSE
jgi:hypothetical protein